jgi:hypothetical protein
MSHLTDTTLIVYGQLSAAAFAVYTKDKERLLYITIDELQTMLQSLEPGSEGDVYLFEPLTKLHHTAITLGASHVFVFPVSLDLWVNYYFQESARRVR